ncbi:segregation/condensation protein A [Cytophagaceae bacterium YF14B1]|uniref:Segregation and condensation protein A n=1 Tax=Xanthocytophaga flava TaxID=3048013 RepID=A0AAE3QM32_9BACT|nr:segregation/condensation protein A [Xanthocytophaga flavus]MDJ1481455.1 segregation/condensation protein A [Xanthocytophaga flavus]
MNFEIKLPLFEGPFDLLLFFIERDELDIHDIPISRITDEFLTYLHELEAINIDLASEFILVAATLMRIKAKMLLPRPELDEQGNEIDPRDELVKHLLEYKKYKSVIGEFSKWEEDRQNQEVRGNIVKELHSIAEKSNVDVELQDLDLYKLLKVYQKVLTRYQINQNRPIHKVIQYPYTIEGQKKWITERLNADYRLSFTDIIALNDSKIAVIYNFLAILEMIQYGLAYIRVGEGFNNFWIERKEEKEEQEALVEGE